MNAGHKPEVLIVEDEYLDDLELYRREIQAIVPGATIHTAGTSAEALRVAAGITVLVGKAHSIDPALIRAAPRLAWIHTLTTGIDAVLAAQPRPEILITTARG